MLAEKLLTPVMRYLTAKNLDLEQVENYPLPKAKPGKDYLLYVHIPFCETLCPYCSFNRFVFRESIARNYFTALRQEMRMVAEKGYHFSSMYIGGGTPTVMMDELVQTIDLAKQLFPIREVSCETNPNHLTPLVIDLLELLEGLRDAFPHRLIAGGGVGSDADLDLYERLGLDGAIVGRALYEGRITYPRTA